MTDDNKLIDAVNAFALHGSKAAAARALGVARTTLRERLEAAAFRGIKPNTKPPKEKPAPENLSVVESMLKSGATLEEMAGRANAPIDRVETEIDLLRSRGLNIVQHGALYVAERNLRVGNTSEFITLETDKNNRIRLGLSSDKHYGSKYCREDVTENLYRWFADQGVTAVLDAGNYIEGEANFNRYDVSHHGLDEQARNLVESLPQYPGLTTYAVTGDDHEGWYAKREGMDIGRYVEATFRNAGREDWVNLGYMEAYLDIRNKKTGAIAKMLVMHPGGGSAYAVSYRPQKIVESFEGGEKPAALIIGHYHKMSVNLIRNVWAIQSGCAQDQTPFMRKKGIEPHIGGLIVEFEQDPETGALIACKNEMRRFFNRGYYNRRWSPFDTPTLPDRATNRR